jgi:hypothetical protein
MRRGYVYGLICPTLNRVKYVGITVQPLQTRLRRHKSDAKLFNLRGLNKSYKDNWLISLLNCNLLDEVKIIIIEEVTEESMFDREKFWISHYRNLYPDMTNIADGGVVIKNKLITAEQKEKHKLGVQRMFKERPEVKEHISDGLKKHFEKNPVKPGEGSTALIVYSYNLLSKETKKFANHELCCAYHNISKQRLSYARINKKIENNIIFTLEDNFENLSDYSDFDLEHELISKKIFAKNLKTGEITEFKKAKDCSKELNMSERSGCRLARENKIRKGFVYSYSLEYVKEYNFSKTVTTSP